MVSPPERGEERTPSRRWMLLAAQRDFIEAQRVARLATVDARGRPHVVPICFALLDEVLYTPIDEKPKSGDPLSLRRVVNISANPAVQVLFDEYDDADWTRLRYIQLRGRGRIIEASNEHARAVTALRLRYRQYAGMALELRPIIAVDVDRGVEWSWR
jgi:PPOX class probable F420-dependent enzyme